MIVLLLVVLVLLAVALAVASRFVAPTPKVAKAARARVVDAVRRGSPYAYEYALRGPGSADEGDHDRDKIVVYAEPWRRGLIAVRVAPVDRAGRRTGRSRLTFLAK